VRTERQEKRGESLLTQLSQMTQAVQSLGGSITENYSGQEHATEGSERELLDNLLTDAQKQRRTFDAVMVADPSRWSRDNVKSETGLDTLKDAGVKFYVLTTEHDLYDPQARLFLSLSTTIGAFQARVQKQKSLLNRIARAKRGIPTSGDLPYGRTFDRKTGTWGVDPQKQAIIAECAARYLKRPKGESLVNLAREYGIGFSNLYHTLRDKCGDTWACEFKAEDLNICETVLMTVPALLDEDTIKKVRNQLHDNRSRKPHGGKPRHSYLLGGRVFCGHCGYTMTGTYRWGYTYYRHPHCGNRYGKNADCPIRPRPLVRADKLEHEVVLKLFDLFGNPAQIERAIRTAVPDCDEVRQDQQRLQTDLEKTEKAIKRILDLVTKDVIAYEDAAEKLRDLRDRRDSLREQRDRLATALANVPDPEEVRCYVEKVGSNIFVRDDHGNRYLGGNSLSTYAQMTREDDQRLIDAVFSTPLRDGKPAGIYIGPRGADGEWTYRIRGNLEFETVLGEVMNCGQH
jgi:DNA invertase Pin-like site-specific DNA recombinase